MDENKKAKKELIDWVEVQGRSLMLAHLESTDILRKEATITLTVLLAGLGASMSYVVANFAEICDNPIVTATAFLIVYLIMVSITLVLKALMIKDSWPAYNSPDNLLSAMETNKPADLNLLRQQELRLLQDRINWTVERNNKTSKWLNRIRVAAILTPIFWMAVYLSF